MFKASPVYCIGYVSMQADDISDLYSLADHLMDTALQTAITNTVGSIPANIPNISQVMYTLQY